MKKTITLIIAVYLTIMLSGQDVAIFTGDGGDNSWDNPNNWNTQEVPGPSTTAIVPEQYTITGPGSGNNVVGIIENSGTITLTENITIQTNRIDNAGTINVNNSTITSQSEGTHLTVNNSGEFDNVTHAISDLNFERVISFTNSGSLSGENVIVDGSGHFINTASGEVSTGNNLILSVSSVRNNGRLSADGFGEGYVFIGSHYMENNGTISTIIGDIRILAIDNYLREGKKSVIHSCEGNVFKQGYKADITGKSSASGSHNKQSQSINGYKGEIELAFDTCWIVGDSVEIEGETIRFIFDYLHIFAIDSIKDIYANSNIEFYGTAGSTLDLRYNHAEDCIYSETGNITIRTDNIISPDYDINYFCYPDPLVLPSDTTYIESFIGMNFEMDSAGSSGAFRIYCRNNSTGHRAFEYSISSNLGWASTVTGTMPVLAPLQFDSLMIDYHIPYSGDTLTDTVIVIFTIPGEYADTSYSYVRSYPGITTGLNQPVTLENNLQVEISPNPCSGPLMIRTSENASIQIFDFNGRKIDEFPVSKNYPNTWSSFGLEPGIYFIKAKSGKNISTEKVIFI